MGICFFLMPAKIEDREMLEQKGIQESRDGDYLLFCLEDHCESEIQWIKLHQMFDR
tara:strand:- start:106 stop:273 length:168 start_codon:yes stop_codon:yes gene_type:complete